MTVTIQTIRKIENLFEQKLQHALANVKNGSITVIKQDNLIIQVNIFETLEWTYTPTVKQAVCNRLKPVS